MGSPAPGGELLKCGVATVAVYFPGFHHAVENDQIWGYKWTEWDNLLSHDLRKKMAFDKASQHPLLHPQRGYYDTLDRGSVTLRAQALEARNAGFQAFQIYHYWFAYGRGALNQPIEQVIFGSARCSGDGPCGRLGIPFYFSWANPSWEQRWARLQVHRPAADANASSITFINQYYGGPKSWAAHFAYLLPFFQQEEYVKIEGRPVFAIYEPSHINRISRVQVPAACSDQLSHTQECASAPYGCAAAEMYLSWYPHLAKFISLSTAYAYHLNEGRSRGYSWPRSDPCERPLTRADLRGRSTVLQLMLKLWRKLAVENGLPGLHIVGTLNHDHLPSTVLHAAGSERIDGLLQFLPLSIVNVMPAWRGGSLCARWCGKTYPPQCSCLMRFLRSNEVEDKYRELVRASGWNGTFFRGAAASWSNYPRKRIANKFTSWCSHIDPSGYGELVREQLMRALRDASGFSTTQEAAQHCSSISSDAPARQQAAWQHLVVVNSWNEWGEQAAVEPSNQLGDAWLRAHSQAVLSVESMVRAAAAGSTSIQGRALTSTVATSASNLIRGNSALQHPKPSWGLALPRVRIPRCPSTLTCPSTHEQTKVFTFQGAKSDAAFGNLFYSMATNAILYAAHKGYVPFIHLEPSWVSRTMGTSWATSGDALWEHFFEPYCPNISRWLAACPTVTQVVKPRSFYYPKVQLHYHWAVRQWYVFRTKESRDCLKHNWCNTFNSSLYLRWRSHAHSVVSQSHRPNALYRSLTDEEWNRMALSRAHPILAIHMRGSDKRSSTRKEARRAHVPPEAFTPFVEDFFACYPDTGRVLLSTESQENIQFANDTWVNRWGQKIRWRSIATRVKGKKGNFWASSQRSQLQTASDAFIDVLMISRATYLLHEASALVEGAIYHNIGLHWKSTDMEYNHSCVGAGKCADAPWRYDYGESTCH